MNTPEETPKQFRQDAADLHRAIEVMRQHLFTIAAQLNEQDMNTVATLEEYLRRADRLLCTSAIQISQAISNTSEQQK